MRYKTLKIIIGSSDIFVLRCFIPRAYAAFSVAVIPVLLLVLAVVVVFVQAYQVTAQWKYYDDIYRGRHNIKG